ncbi:MAG TPA: hypothetical protein VJ385_20020 [Fibrobacteria bacterium]|nr:hypothetical protein [Fibrobacteria bacterium]
MNTIMLMYHYPQNHFLHSLGVLAFICDSTYIGYFLRLRANGRAVLQTA